jgi:hypothetical protein
LPRGIAGLTGIIPLGLLVMLALIFLHCGVPCGMVQAAVQPAHPVAQA